MQNGGTRQTECVRGARGSRQVINLAAELLHMRCLSPDVQALGPPERLAQCIIDSLLQVIKAIAILTLVRHEV